MSSVKDSVLGFLSAMAPQPYKPEPKTLLFEDIPTYKTKKGDFELITAYTDGQQFVITPKAVEYLGITEEEALKLQDEPALYSAVILMEGFEQKASFIRPKFDIQFQVIQYVRDSASKQTSKEIRELMKHATAELHNVATDVVIVRNTVADLALNEQSKKENEK